MKSEAMAGLLADVRAFHQAMGNDPDPTVPLTDPPRAIVNLRAWLLAEEFLETLVGMFSGSEARENPEIMRKVIAAHMLELKPILAQTAEDFDILQVADGLADLIYVAVGAALAFGIPLDRVWSEVQRANMAKTGGKRSPMGKILKPEGWQPPRIREAVFG